MVPVVSVGKDERSAGRVSVNSKYRPSGGEVSEDVGRELADISTDISAESVDRQRSLLHMITQDSE